MKYIEGQPITFSGQKAFIEKHGDEVWNEFCDTFLLDEWISVTDAARKLKSTKHYADPRQYLVCVLKNVMADYESRPEAYENRPQVKKRGIRMSHVML